MRAVAVHQQQTGLAAFAPGQGFKARAGDLVKAGFWFGREGFTEPGWGRRLPPFECGEKSAAMGLGHGVSRVGVIVNRIVVGLSDDIFCAAHQV